MLNKLNHDSNTGKCGNTPNETIELLPYQDFDIILPASHKSTHPLHKPRPKQGTSSCQCKLQANTDQRTT